MQTAKYNLEGGSSLVLKIPPKKLDLSIDFVTQTQLWI
jgi:hypothetical protein